MRPALGQGACDPQLLHVLHQPHIRAVGRDPAQGRERGVVGAVLYEDDLVASRIDARLGLYGPNAVHDECLRVPNRHEPADQGSGRRQRLRHAPGRRHGGDADGAQVVVPVSLRLQKPGQPCRRRRSGIHLAEVLHEFLQLPAELRGEPRRPLGAAAAVDAVAAKEVLAEEAVGGGGVAEVAGLQGDEDRGLEASGLVAELAAFHPLPSAQPICRLVVQLPGGLYRGLQGGEEVLHVLGPDDRRRLVEDRVPTHLARHGLEGHLALVVPPRPKEHPGIAREGPEQRGRGEEFRLGEVVHSGVQVQAEGESPPPLAEHLQSDAQIHGRMQQRHIREEEHMLQPFGGQAIHRAGERGEELAMRDVDPIHRSILEPRRLGEGLQQLVGVDAPPLKCLPEDIHLQRDALHVLPQRAQASVALQRPVLGEQEYAQPLRRRNLLHRLVRLLRQALSHRVDNLQRMRILRLEREHRARIL
mmetsp:Transcript_67893/g.196515  ORF Transcript_67893/g.196515 Transcript_67893/m.196515 type:complete len:473 (+) Transcript_67893:1072-2490(+)